MDKTWTGMYGFLKLDNLVAHEEKLTKENMGMDPGSTPVLPTMGSSVEAGEITRLSVTFFSNLVTWHKCVWILVRKYTVSTITFLFVWLRSIILKFDLRILSAGMSMFTSCFHMFLKLSNSKVSTFMEGKQTKYAL